MAQTVVKIENLVKRYSSMLAVDHFNLDIKEGEILGLLGPNGSGKTTTINCLLSLLKYDKGTVEIFGKPMLPDSYGIKRNIGIVSQNVAVFDELNVYSNIDYFCGLYIKNKAEREQLVQEALAFTELADYKKIYPKKLSGGLLRRLNIACGVAHKPNLIIMDEPTVAVDPQSRNHILQGIINLNKNGATIMYTSHYMEEVEQICSRIVIMDKGRNLADGTKEELKMMIKTGETIRLEILDLSDSHIEAVKNLAHVFSVNYEDSMLTVRCRKGSHNLVTILNYLTQNNIACGRVLSELPTLNDVFLEITGKDLRD
jgi:ABC-2 type transport system ATP-binding protein